MARDFAHNAAPSTVKQPSSSGTDASVVSIIFIAGACFAAGYWIGTGAMHNNSSNKTDTDAVKAQMGTQLATKEAQIKLQQVKIETLESLVEQWKNKANADAHTKVGELSFYKELPKQSVTPAPVSAKPITQRIKQAKPVERHHVTAPPNATPAAQDTTDHIAYRLQIASFRRQEDAIPVQQKLLQNDFIAFIQQVDLADKGIWFRVYAGPFASKSDAEDGQQRMQQQLHLKGLLVRGSK